MRKLEDHPLWKKVNKVGKHIYALQDEIPEEEKYGIASNFRHGASNAVFAVGEALGGSANQFGSSYDWQNLARYVGALKSLYIFAGKQGYYRLDPEMVVLMTEIIEEAQKMELKALKEMEESKFKEFASVQKRYQLWKEMQG